MLGASLLLHGGIIGLAALQNPPEPPARSIPFDWIDAAGPVDSVPNPPSVLPQVTPAETPEPTSTPETVVEPNVTPPQPTDDPDFAEPPASTPIHQASPSKSVPARPANPRANLTTVPGHPLGTMAAGSHAGSQGLAAGWVMPHPPYPRVSSAFRPTGSTTVRISTDASGRVSNVVIVKSAGNALLDNETQSYVRMNWHGPPNADRTTEFVYQIR